MKGLETKLKGIKQHEHEDEEERGAVKEIANDLNMCFNNNNDYCTNK